jgi:hypothetical protein
MKPKSGRRRVTDRGLRDQRFHILLTKSEYQFIINTAKKNSRTASDELRRRLLTTFGGKYTDDFADVIGDEIAIKALERRGWFQCVDQRYGGTVLVPPGSAPPGPFVPVNIEEAVPQIIAAENVERTLRGVFEAFGIPVEQRTSIREGLFRTLIKHLPKREGEGMGALPAPATAERVSAIGR